MGFVDLDGPPTKIRSVECANGVLASTYIFHFYKREPARAARFTVRDHIHRRNASVPAKHVSEVGLRAGKGEVSDVDLLAQIVVLFAPQPVFRFGA